MLHSDFLVELPASSQALDIGVRLLDGLRIGDQEWLVSLSVNDDSKHAPTPILGTDWPYSGVIRNNYQYLPQMADRHIKLLPRIAFTYVVPQLLISVYPWKSGAVGKAHELFDFYCFVQLGTAETLMMPARRCQ